MRGRQRPAMAAGKARGAESAGSPGGADGRQIDELHRLVGRIVAVDQEVVNKVGMCVASGERRGARPGPGAEPAPRPDGAKRPRRVEENVKLLELYWNEMVGVDPDAASYADFANHVRGSHQGRNMVAHGAVARREGAIKNVKERRVYMREDLEAQLGLTLRAREDVNRIYRHLGLADYEEYMEAVRGVRGTRA